MRRNRGGAPTSSRAGAALLEVLVALTILTTTGTAAVVMASESARAVERARNAGDEIQAAGAFLDAVALWPREDLDRRLGERRQGPWLLRVERPLPTLYTVVLSDTLARHELLATALYRPEVGRAAP